MENDEGPVYVTVVDTQDRKRKIFRIVLGLLGALLVFGIAAIVVFLKLFVLKDQPATPRSSDETTIRTTAVTQRSTTVSVGTRTTTTTSIVLTTTPASLAPSLWAFDGNTLDSWSTRHGVTSQPTAYTTNVLYGNDSALIFSMESEQYVQVNTYQSLSYQSFTVEIWFYCTTLLYASYGLFGQHEAHQNSRSLHIEIRDYVLNFGFYDNDLTTDYHLNENIWYHAAFVYDFLNQVQIIYLNGHQIGRRITQAYQGASGPITIGRTDNHPEDPVYFDGYIDEVSLVMRAKSAAEIEAIALDHLGTDRLVSWHSFDNDSLTDRASIPLPAVSADITYVTGRINQAIRFSSIQSYYQIPGFKFLGQADFPHSMSLWVKPSSVSGATLIHSSTVADGTGWCDVLLGFSSTGRIVATSAIDDYVVEVIGPIMSVNNWTHIATTYSTSNGLRLYVNGLLVGSTGSKRYTASRSVNILTLGNSIRGKPLGGIDGICISQSIQPKVYQGVIDEFRVFAKELSGAEIWTLSYA